MPTDRPATDLGDRPASASALPERAITVAMVAGLLVIVGLILGAGVAGYPALAAEEDIYLEQAWTLNHDALSHVTSWYPNLPLGWIEVWLMASLTGPVLNGQSAASQGRILMLALASAALLYVLARAPRATAERLAAVAAY
jgi:hypothetical protein